MSQELVLSQVTRAGHHHHYYHHHHHLSFGQQYINVKVPERQPT